MKRPNALRPQHARPDQGKGHVFAMADIGLGPLAPISNSANTGAMVLVAVLAFILVSAFVASFRRPHLPHFERRGDAATKMDVLARQFIDLKAPPHPFTAGGQSTFDCLLQSRPELFSGDLLVGDATLRFWPTSFAGRRRAG